MEEKPSSTSLPGIFELALMCISYKNQVKLSGLSCQLRTLYKVREVTSLLVYYVRMDEGRQPLSRKLPISSSKINPYRMIILLRLTILGLFFHYRLLHPVHDAYALWMTSVICEIWFALSWILDQFPKWYPIERETYLERLSLRYVRPVC